MRHKTLKLNATEKQVEETFNFPYNVTKDHKLREIQLILHNILYTKTKLLKIGKVESSLCSFCSSSPETLEHLFVYCTCTQKFWIDLYDFIECTPTITIPNILYGQVNGLTTLLESLAILIGKKIIYYNSLKETIPHVKEAVYDLKSHMETDFYYNRIIPRNMEKWNPVIHKFNNL